MHTELPLYAIYHCQSRCATSQFSRRFQNSFSTIDIDVRNTETGMDGPTRGDRAVPMQRHRDNPTVYCPDAKCYCKMIMSAGFIYTTDRIEKKKHRSSLKSI